jgi:hypothetical protein
MACPADRTTFASELTVGFMVSELPLLGLLALLLAFLNRMLPAVCCQAACRQATQHN